MYMKILPLIIYLDSGEQWTSTSVKKLGLNTSQDMCGLILAKQRLVGGFSRHHPVRTVKKQHGSQKNNRRQC